MHQLLKGSRYRTWEKRQPEFQLKTLRELLLKFRQFLSPKAILGFTPSRPLDFMPAAVKFDSKSLNVRYIYTSTSCSFYFMGKSVSRMS